MSIRPRVEKLPLAVRKSLRDDFENKKAEIEAELSRILETEWKVEVDPNAVWAYGDSGYAKENLGRMITEYFEGAGRRLDEQSSATKAEINKLAPEHVITLEADDANRFNYCGVIFKEGKLRILFSPKSIATNINQAAEAGVLQKALNEAGKASEGEDAISFVARTSIQESYDKGINEVSEKIAELLGKPLKLVPNFETNYPKLVEESKKKKSELNSSWERGFGGWTLNYFKGLRSQLDWQKFEDDEMLQEGFFELVDKETVEFRIVDKIDPSRRYNDIVIEDGVLVIRAPAVNFGTNMDAAAEKLLSML